MSISVSAYCIRSTNTLLAIASAMQISTIKYADLNDQRGIRDADLSISMSAHYSIRSTIHWRGWLFVSCWKRRRSKKLLNTTTLARLWLQPRAHICFGGFVCVLMCLGFVANLNTLPPDVQFLQPQRHYSVARSPRRARQRAREHTQTHQNTLHTFP